jgi:hypothetical protein
MMPLCLRDYDMQVHSDVGPFDVPDNRKVRWTVLTQHLTIHGDSFNGWMPRKHTATEQSAIAYARQLRKKYDHFVVVVNIEHGFSQTIF